MWSLESTATGERETKLSGLSGNSAAVYYLLVCVCRVRVHSTQKVKKCVTSMCDLCEIRKSRIENARAPFFRARASPPIALAIVVRELLIVLMLDIILWHAGRSQVPI